MGLLGKTGVYEMGLLHKFVDEMGVDEMGVDQLGCYRIETGGVDWMAGRPPTDRTLDRLEFYFTINEICTL